MAMKDDVSLCVNARLDFFSKYYAVPPEMAAEVNAFASGLLAMAEGCTDAMDFEQKFNTTGLSAQFNAILPRLQPVAQQMTAQQQAEARAIYQQMRAEQGESLAGDIAKEFADDVAMKAKSDLTAAKREVLIESGTLDEYTRITNAVEDTGYAGGFLGRLFKRKK